MPTITGHEIEPCSVRLERVGSEDMLAALLVFGEMRQDWPETCLPALADVISDVVAIVEGA